MVVCGVCMRACVRACVHSCERVMRVSVRVCVCPASIANTRERKGGRGDGGWQVGKEFIGGRG